VLLSLPAPAEIPARPVAAIKLGNLSSAAAVAPGQARADLENARTAFGFATVQRPEPLPEQRVRPAAFGDVSFGAAKPAEKNPPRPAAITPVEILFKPRPEYTEEALRLRLEGEVVLEVRFTAAGAAEVLRLVRGLGHGLDEAAGRAARAIRFRPAMQSGQPVDTTALVHILFELAY
jgi:TonB family protein